MLEQRAMRLAFGVLRRVFDELSGPGNDTIDRRCIRDIRDALQRHWPPKQVRRSRRSLARGVEEWSVTESGAGGVPPE